MKMHLAYPRTALAFLLTVGAIAVPCGSWYYAGQRQLDHQEVANRKAAMAKSHKKIVVVAERLATRFELIRESESRRPFYHYQNLFHDPKGAAEGLSVSISPLAQGSGNPMIETHFQVDETGHLSLPSLNDEFPELGSHSAESSECELLWKLQDVAVFSKLEMGESAQIGMGSRWRSTPWDLEDEGIEAAVSGAPLTSVSVGPNVQVVDLSPTAWHQHLQANALYADLKFGTHEGESLACRRSLRDGVDKVVVKVGPLGWHTLPVGGEQALVALRNVETPAGQWVQGFVVSSSAVENLLDSSPDPATFTPRGESPRRSNSVSMVIDGTPWQVNLDISEKLALHEAEIGAQRQSFLNLFLLGAFGAGLAGLLVVTMVYQSERLAQQRAQFAAAAAHELRTPLAGLRLYGEMLAEGLGNPQRSRDYARRMAGEAERLGRVVTNVLGFSRLERGAMPVHPEVGDLAVAVSEAFQRQRMALEESGAEVELDFEPNLPPVAFDRDALAHIVQNLLDNAEKYTRDVGDRQIVLRLARESELVVLSVADNGRGISKQLRRHLFEPYTRGEDKDAPEGLGLGLVLVRMLARAQGADIDYQDAPEGGAVFRVSFPVAAEPILG